MIIKKQIRKMHKIFSVSEAISVGIPYNNRGENLGNIKIRMLKEDRKAITRSLLPMQNKLMWDFADSIKMVHS